MTMVRQLFGKPWIWAFLATLATFVVTILFTGGASTVGLTQAALTFGAFSVIVGLGQMFVVTLGPGNVDLSIPATMTLAGTVALKVMDTQDGLIWLGLLVTLATGLVIGIANYGLIKLLRIPPIIATLSASFIVQSAAIWTNRGIRIKPPELLAQFSTTSTLGVPNVAWIALLRWNAAFMAGSSRPSGRTCGRRVWPACRSTACALPPMCSVPCSRRSPAFCSAAFRAARRSTWGQNTCSPRLPWW